jgi:hypothetical protein
MESRNEKDGEDEHENRNGKKKTDCDIRNNPWKLLYSEEPNEFEISKISKSSGYSE